MADLAQAQFAPVIGLTGGIGSGKTAASQVLVDLGAAHIDADRVGHDVYLPGTPGFHQVIEAFGADIVGAEGHIDRKRLGAIVFAEPSALQNLNSIVHPLILNEADRRIQQARDEDPTRPIVLEAAVLLEANWTDPVDEIWVVVADRDAIIDRVVSARGMTPEAIAARMDAQLSDAERRTRADVIIDNRGSLADLRRFLATEWARLSAVDRS